jgi:hypothetical protein
MLDTVEDSQSTAAELRGIIAAFSHGPSLKINFPLRIVSRTT